MKESVDALVSAAWRPSNTLVCCHIPAIDGSDRRELKNADGKDVGSAHRLGGAVGDRGAAAADDSTAPLAQLRDTPNELPTLVAGRLG